MFMLNGTPLSPDAPFTTADGTQYPANWLRLASAEDKTAIGITEVADPLPFDGKYYYGRDINGDLLPRPLADCKTMRVSEVTAQAYSLLLITDWEVIRATEVPPQGQALTDYQALQVMRATIRTNSNSAEAAINACADVAELAALPMAQLAPEGYLPDMMPPA